jgi:imidazolonepropionase-like amidohydrolase
MKHVFLVVAIFLVPAGSCAQSAQEQARQPIAISHVTVVDVRAGRTLPDQTVIISGDRITSVGKSADIALPADANVINRSAKFLIPGLWDMHVHIAAPSYLPLLVANGVTGVREMHAFFPDTILQMRKSINEGKQLGPRIIAAGALIDGPKPLWPGSYSAGNEKEGREAVQTLKRRGADFIKVYSKLPREAYFGIADEAKKEGMVFAGHVPESVSAAEASDAGQKSMEHLVGLWVACSDREAEIRKETVDLMTKADNQAVLLVMGRSQLKAQESFKKEKADALFAKFVKNGTWQVPTLTVLRALASLGDEQFTSDSRVKYMPSFVKSMWNPDSPRIKSVRERSDNMRQLFKGSLEMVKSMHQAGVRILAGTDTTNPYCFPGFSLHDELELLVKAGFTPAEALQSATYNPAEYFDMLKDLGTVEKGKTADLVLLDANPLDDISNTRRIAAVVVRGKVLTAEMIKKMLAEVEGQGVKK